MPADTTQAIAMAPMIEVGVMATGRMGAERTTGWLVDDLKTIYKF